MASRPSSRPHSLSLSPSPDPMDGSVYSMETLDKGDDSLARMRFYHDIQNAMQFKTYELFTS